MKETLPRARLTLLASPAGATAMPLLPWLDDVMIWRPIWQDVGGRVPPEPARDRELIAALDVEPPESAQTGPGRVAG